MTKNELVTVAVVVTIAALVAGACAKAPTQELEAAQVALAEAEAAGAADYAPEQWQTAQTTLNAAQAKIEEQNGKLGMMRSYDDAKTLLAQASTEAAAARDAAATGKEAARAASEACWPSPSALIGWLKTMSERMSAWSSGGRLESVSSGLLIVPAIWMEASTPEITRCAVTFSDGLITGSPSKRMMPPRRMSNWRPWNS